MVASGAFREDLYYRLNVVPITIPPLRERKDDLWQLCHFYLEKFNEKYKTDKVFHQATVNAMLDYQWPGNVRELENLVERLVITTEGRVIYPNALPFHAQTNASSPEMESEVWEEGGSLQQALEQVEIRWLKRAARQYKTTYEMAEYLGISQSSVVRKLKKYGINS